MTPADVLALLKEPVDYAATVCRIVESQEEAATYSLVKNLDEQAVLEQIIDDFKPVCPDGMDGLHYLIKTPFRYPPLKHGSRFGTRLEASFFYASEDATTCFAEAAFYRFAFFKAMEFPYKGNVLSAHQLFDVLIKTTTALDLTLISEQQTVKQLTSRTSYAFTQEVGKLARERAIEMIRFHSARFDSGYNVAIASPKAIMSKHPESIKMVQCETIPAEGIVRYSTPKSFPITFRIEQFLVEDRFPYPPA